LLQETLLTAFRSMRELGEARAFRPWLLRIAQNTAIDAARRDSRKKRAGRSPASAAVLATVAGSAPSPDAQLAEKEVREQVLAVLRSLPEEYRLPLTLRYIGGADYDTICTQLGLSNGSLRGLLQRGLKLLRKELPEDLLGERSVSP
jgi:RNA polymerase sigma-70 factor (ECF subfamily)